ncbi:hypothetical protein ABEB36_004547 [Hypothenemus hampei]|uniref:Uncharacterized protein n=1 Tax=Hypothenemus hampei TaxID=57062 RepID=A0ABD1F3N6_HYPHA
MGDLFNHISDDQWLGNNGPFVWSEWLRNMTPLDFFLWGVIKDFYANNKGELSRPGLSQIENLTPKQILKVTITGVVKPCKKEGGGHFEHLLLVTFIPTTL